MLVTMYDVASKCPIAKWIERTFTIKVDVGDQAVVIRSRLQDMANFKCTEDMLRATTLLQDKPDNILSLVAKIVNQKVNQLANEQAKLAELCAAIVEDLHNNVIALPVMCVVGEALFDILAKYEPDATLAGWRSWLKLCEAYLIQQ
jgi:hypothetical protein